MSSEPAKYIIVGGPNGSGKSTLTALRKDLIGMTIIDADAIARDLNSTDPNSAASRAGRLAISKLDEAISQGSSVLQETTLSGKNLIRRIHHARSKGMTVELHYIGLGSAEQAQYRVQTRVSKGGHDVPNKDVVRRYERGLEVLPKIIPLCDWAFLYDNASLDGHQLFAVFDAGRCMGVRGAVPSWATQLVQPVQV